MGKCFSSDGGSTVKPGTKYTVQVDKSGISRVAKVPKADEFGLPPERFEVVKLLGHGGEATTYLVKERLGSIKRPLGTVTPPVFDNSHHEGNLYQEALNSQAVAADLAANGPAAHTNHHNGANKNAGYFFQAMKILPRGETLDEKFVAREIIIQSSLSHIHIVKLKEVLLTPSHLCIKLEWAEGGELYKYIKGVKPVSPDQLLTEEMARYFFQQFIEAVEYLHKMRVAHRDLKLANTLIDGSNPPRLKLCDFGLSRMWEENEDMNAVTTVGTPMYMSPEMMIAHKKREKSAVLKAQIQENMALQGVQVIESTADQAPRASEGRRPSNPGEPIGYDPMTGDIWSCGVLLFVLLLGRFPFKASTTSQGFDSVLKEIRTAHAVDPQNLQSLWGESKVSKEAKDLLNQIFIVEPTKRITVQRIKEHPWYKGKLPGQLEKTIKACREAQRAAETRDEKVQKIEPGSEPETSLRRLVHEAAVVKFGAANEIQSWTPPINQRIHTVLSSKDLKGMNSK